MTLQLQTLPRYFSRNHYLTTFAKLITSPIIQLQPLHLTCWHTSHCSSFILPQRRCYHCPATPFIISQRKCNHCHATFGSASYVSHNVTATTAMLLLVLLPRYFYFCSSCLPQCSCNHCPATFCHICPHFPSREEQRPVLKARPVQGSHCVCFPYWFTRFASNLTHTNKTRPNSRGVGTASIEEPQTGTVEP
jgi:hypothetical protein